MCEAYSSVRSQTDQSHTEGRNEIPIRGLPERMERESLSGPSVLTCRVRLNTLRSACDDKIVGKALCRVDMHAAISR